jgi:tetratricopeptide (TPR) repeat protein
MHATATKEEVEARGVREDPGLFESAPYADTYRLRFRGMRHADFTSYSMVEGLAPGFSGPPKINPRPAYEALCRYVLNFLNAFVKGDREGLSFISRKTEGGAAPGALFTVESRQGRPAPPTEDQFVNLILEEGPERAARTYREVSARYPGYALFREATLNRLGYEFLNRRADAKGAVQIFLMNVEAFPESWNAYDSLAEAYLADGQPALAVKNYKKSLELNPQNGNASEALKKIERR